MIKYRKNNNLKRKVIKNKWMNFYNKNIVITGVSSGIGLSSAFYFLNSNTNIVLAVKMLKQWKKFVKKIIF